MNTIIGRIENWLADYLQQSELNGLVVGVSGGIDSLVTACLCQRVSLSTGRTLHTLGLPITNGGQLDGTDISSILSKRSIPYYRLDLSEQYGAFLAQFPLASSVVRSNIRTRLRATAIYTHANIHQLLVVGTLNRTEFGIGYFQKHAAIGDILPLARLSKSEIRDLAVLLEIPIEFRSQKASGCASGMSAEIEWGFTEDDADRCIRRDWSVDTAAEVSPDVLKSISSLNAATKHKRKFPPVYEP